MKTAMLGLLVETPIHPGSGRSLGVVDLPVAREASTDYPVLVGSSLKGALRDRARSKMPDREDKIFGKADHAGELLVGDARLLLLPVRSLTSSYRWVTCPHLIERFSRDRGRAGLDPRPAVPIVAPRSALADVNGALFLEERKFTIAGALPAELIDVLETLLLHDDTRKRLRKQIAILADEDFVWFARFGLSIQARNDLADGTKKSENLWYEESLPPDTVMYSLISGRSDTALRMLNELFPKSDPYLQAGGNETVGHGWFAVRVLNAEGGGA